MDSEYEVKPEELDHWLRLPVTQEFCRRLLAAFDHQENLQGASPGSSVDLFVGRAQVLAYILKPYSLFEE